MPLGSRRALRAIRRLPLGATMVDFPTIVQEALTVCGEVFDTEAARRHCAA